MVTCKLGVVVNRVVENPKNTVRMNSVTYGQFLLVHLSAEAVLCFDWEMVVFKLPFTHEHSSKC